MPYFALRYQLTYDYLERRRALRAEHLALAERYVAQGRLVLGGAFEDLSAGALLIFEVERAAEVEAFAKTDPYVLNGLVETYSVVAWNVVVGTAIKKA